MMKATLKGMRKGVEVWFNHFSKLVGGGSVGEAHTAPELSRQEDDHLDLSDRLCSPISYSPILLGYNAFACV